MREVEVQTSLPAAGVPELLKPTADLLSGPSLAGDMVNVIRDEAIAIWEPAQRAGRTGGLWTVLIESWGGWNAKQRRERKVKGRLGGGRTFYESSLEVWRPDSFALPLEGLPALPATDNGIDSVSGPVVARQGIREVIDR